MVDPNSRTWQALGLAADVVVVNALTIVCSLPVVTAGAALSAAHGTLLEMVREEGAKPARTYFSYFTRTWRTATFGWLLLLAVGSVLGWEDWALGRMDGGAALGLTALDHPERVRLHQVRLARPQLGDARLDLPERDLRLPDHRRGEQLHRRLRARGQRPRLLGGAD